MSWPTVSPLYYFYSRNANTTLCDSGLPFGGLPFWWAAVWAWGNWKSQAIKQRNFDLNLSQNIEPVAKWLKICTRHFKCIFLAVFWEQFHWSVFVKVQPTMTGFMYVIPRLDVLNVVLWKVQYFAANKFMFENYILCMWILCGDYLSQCHVTQCNAVSRLDKFVAHTVKSLI